MRKHYKISGVIIYASIHSLQFTFINKHNETCRKTHRILSLVSHLWPSVHYQHNEIRHAEDHLVWHSCPPLNKHSYIHMRANCKLSACVCMSMLLWYLSVPSTHFTLQGDSFSNIKTAYNQINHDKQNWLFYICSVVFM